MKPILKFKKLAHFTGLIPNYQTKGASGCDVHAAVEEVVILKPGDRAAIPTGLILEIPSGYEIQVRPRSGLALKHGITLPNTPGTIDSDYRGELKILVANWGREDFKISRGDRIAQLVVSPVIQAQFIESEDLTDTHRGEGGFGSTGSN